MNNKTNKKEVSAMLTLFTTATAVLVLVAISHKRKFKERQGVGAALAGNKDTGPKNSVRAINVKECEFET